jgi:hypothetical protein
VDTIIAPPVTQLSQKQQSTPGGPRRRDTEKRAALDDLRQAIFQHDLWYENFNRTIICNQPPDERDVAEDAHRRWPFGKWLYGSGASRLGSHPNFSQIVAANELMHRYAAMMLKTASVRGRILLDDYELFLDHSETDACASSHNQAPARRRAP